MSLQWGSLTEVLGWTLLHFVWQGTVAALALGGILSLLPRRWANPRYVLACATLAAMALLPLATGLALAQRSVSPLEFAWAAPGTPVSMARPEAGPGQRHDPAAAEISVWHQDVNAGGTRASATAAPLTSWFPWLIACWLAGVCVCSIRLAGGWWQARRLIREDAFEADEVWLRAVTQLAKRLAVRTPVRLRESARVQVPVVVGALKPVLLLPAAALFGLTPQQVEAVLAHELAHIRRHDYLVNLLQSVVETVLFYHPGVWWVSHTIRVEREHCCDDLAVRACGDPLMYARALTTIETLRQERVGIAMAASSGSLLSRVRRLLGVRPSTRLATSGWAVLSLTALMVAAAGVTGWLGAALKQVPALAQSADVTPAHTGPAVPTDGQAAPADQPLPRDAEPAELGDTWTPADLQPALDAAMRDIEASMAQMVEEAERETQRELRSATARADAALEEVGKDIEHITREAIETAELQTGEALGTLLDDRARQDLHRELQESRTQLEAHRGEIERHARELAAQARTMRREILRSHREMLQSLHGEQARAFREQARAMAEHARELAAQARALAAESLRSFHFEGEDGGQHAPEPPEPPQVPAPPAPPNAVPTPPASPAPPVPPAPPAPPAPPRGAASMNRHKDGTWSMMRSDNGKSVKVEGKGRVTFTDDDTDVKTLDAGRILLDRDQERLGLSVRHGARRGERGQRRVAVADLPHRWQSRIGD